MTKYKHSESGKITRVFQGKEDHGILTCVISLEGDGWGQGFGCLAFETEELLADFMSDLCKTFGVSDPAMLVGQECNALYAFKHYWGHPIAALASYETGDIFDLYVWRRKHWPNTMTPEQEHLDGKKRRVEYARLELARAQAALATDDD